MAKKSDANGVLIIGPPRSGTTLLAGLVAEHPRAGVTMEGMGHDARYLMGVKVWANKLCVPNQITLEPVPDQRTLYRRLEDGLRAVLGRPRLRGKIRDHDPAYYTPPKHRQTTIQTYVDQWGADILAIVRDPDQTVASMQKRGNERLSLDQARHRWAKAIHIIKNTHERWPGRVHFVTFADLLLDTENTLKGVCKYLGVEFEPNMLNGYINTPQYENKCIDTGKVEKEAPGCNMKTYDPEAFHFYKSLK